jgi:hypothetical protein
MPIHGSRSPRCAPRPRRACSPPRLPSSCVRAGGARPEEDPPAERPNHRLIALVSSRARSIDARPSGPEPSLRTSCCTSTAPIAVHPRRPRARSRGTHGQPSRKASPSPRRLPDGFTQQPPCKARAGAECRFSSL